MLESRGVDGYQLGARLFPYSDVYFAALNRARPLAEVAAQPVFEGAALARHAAKRDDISLRAFLGKWYEAALVLDALRMTGLLRRFEAMLDIGSGPALQPRAMKLAGRVNRVEALDIYDGTGRCSEALLRRHGTMAAVLYALSRARCVLPEKWRRSHAFLAKLDSKLPYGVETFSHWPDERLLGRLRPWRGSIDAYHVGDLFAHEGRYDLITSFMALDYIDFSRLTEKVADLLVPGGVFAFIVSYWWYPINNTLLYGRFPYLLQQLATEEVLAYFSAVHPDVPHESLSRRLTYSDPVRRTVSDYEDTAWVNGLTLRLALRLAPSADGNLRAVVGPREIDRLPGWSLGKVLANARRLNPTVALADLSTSHIAMIFVRR